jgi:coenzyme F420-0:L-glutamate ligase / coenzyme F420-1:gamma-L-glutamate ligase
MVVVAARRRTWAAWGGGFELGNMQLAIQAIDGIPRVEPGDDLAGLLIAALEGCGIALRARDILVVTSKIVSKAEGRYLDLGRIEPSERARELAQITRRDARLVEAILGEATEVVRAKPNVLIVATRHGFVMANAGIDQSNLEAQDHGRRVLLLPQAPDDSARRLKERLDAHFRADIGVIISDSVGRAWRLGTVGLAIGAAGVPALWDRRGEKDLSGRPLEVTEVGFADAVAAVAVLAMGEAAEGRPAALVCGLDWSAPVRPASALIRPRPEDLFR